MGVVSSGGCSSPFLISRGTAVRVTGRGVGRPPGSCVCVCVCVCVRVCVCTVCVCLREVGSLPSLHGCEAERGASDGPWYEREGRLEHEPSRDTS